MDSPWVWTDSYGDEDQYLVNLNTGATIRFTTNTKPGTGWAIVLQHGTRVHVLGSHYEDASEASEDLSTIGRHVNATNLVG